MAISPEKQKALQEALARLEIRSEEVIERFIRSSGAGGQKVNKTSSAVYLRHIPSGLEVKMQKERSQALNRFLAWRLLAEKIEALQGGKILQHQQLEKIRRQKDRRLRRAKKIPKHPIEE
jgi:peptide chain release factor